MLRACCALPLLLLCLAPPSWADQDQDQGSGPWALKRSDPLEDATFFAVRGKKNYEDFALKPNSLFSPLASKRFGSMKPNSLFSALASKRFGGMKPNSLFGAIPGKRSLKPNSLFSAIPGRRSYMGFKARGKRFMKPNSLFGAIHNKRESEYWPHLGKRSMKPNSLFGAIHGKRSMKPNSLFGAIHGKRSIKPNGLFGSLRAIKPKRSYEPWNPSPSSFQMMWPSFLGWGMNGDLFNQMEDENDYEDSADVTDETEDLYEVGPDFWKQLGLRRPDKKEAATEFWATRGKRDFWASRGKRGEDHMEPEEDDLNQATTN